MKKYFKRNLGPALTDKEKQLSRISAGLMISSGFVYFFLSFFFLELRAGLPFKDLFGVYMISFGLSTVGLGFVINRPPSQRIYFAVIFFVLSFLIPVIDYMMLRADFPNSFFIL